MDSRQLRKLVCPAIEIALCAETRQIAKLTYDDELDIESHIEGLIPHRDEAEDQGLANLQVCCDAAVEFIDQYNEDKDQSQYINSRNFCRLVHAIIGPKLVPSLGDGGIDRLRPNSVEKDEESDKEMNPEASSHEMSSHKGRTQRNNSNPVAQTDGTAPEADTSMDEPRFQPKAQWNDHQIRQMIWLKHYREFNGPRIAIKLNRSLNSIHNKYCKVMGDEAWKPYVKECREKREKLQALPPPTRD